MNATCAGKDSISKFKILRYIKFQIVQYYLDALQSSLCILFCYIFQANSIDSLISWHNPLEHQDLRVADEDKIAAWRATTMTEKQWRETAAYAWEISPTLAVFLPSR